MYVTLDVVFHEDNMYFPYTFDLQGEYEKEFQTLDYGVCVFLRFGKFLNL